MFDRDDLKAIIDFGADRSVAALGEVRANPEVGARGEHDAEVVAWE